MKRKVISVLWVTGTMLPDLCTALGKKEEYGGGWQVEPAKQLAADDRFHLSIATPWNGKEIKKLAVNHIDYYLFPCNYFERFKRPSKRSREYCNSIIREAKPDVIHIYGSEFAYSIPFAEASEIPKVLSIQGLIGKINSSYFYGGISMPSWLGCVMPWNVFTYMPMKLQHARNIWRAKSEETQLKSVDSIIGCTRWDYTFSKLINPDLEYHAVDYAIRRSFAQYSWDVDNCERHTFLLGNMTVPLKGMHKAILALKLLLKKYPDAKIKVVGRNTFDRKIKYGYCRYLYKKVMQLNVMDHIEFLGPQDEMGMVNAMLKSNAFVLSSCIENGPNTMMEAMYLGLPCVCSYVGGAMQFAKEGEEALFYRYEEPEILAYELDRIWSNDELASQLSNSAKKRAEKFDDYEKVTEKYKRIYEKMASSEGKKNGGT